MNANVIHLERTGIWMCIDHSHSVLIWIMDYCQYLENWPPYLKYIQFLLEVQTFGINILCLIGSGYPEVSATILKKQLDNLKAFMEWLTGEEPFLEALELCLNMRTKVWNYGIMDKNYGIQRKCWKYCQIRHALHWQRKLHLMTKVQNHVLTSSALNQHIVYGTILDKIHTQFTQLRHSAHRLKVETGRFIYKERTEHVWGSTHPGWIPHPFQLS